MPKKTIVKRAVAAVRTVAGAALDAGAQEARRVLAKTVANTATPGARKKPARKGKAAARRKASGRKTAARSKRR